MSGDLRALIKAAAFDLPIGEDVSYSRGYSAGVAGVRQTLLDSIPKGAVLVTEETLAAALHDRAFDDQVHEARTGDGPECWAFAAAILRHLREGTDPTLSEADAAAERELHRRWLDASEGLE